MNKQVITIGLSESLNEKYRECVSIVQLSLTTFQTVDEAIGFIEKEACGLILLDASRQSVDDVQAAVQRLRKLTYAPLLVLSTREAAAPALEVGADVCIPPDTEMQGLFSQAMALVRRSEMYNHFENTDPDMLFHRGDLVIDLRRYRVTLAGKEIQLQRREFRLLALFARNPGIVLTPDQISQAVWMAESGYGHNISTAVAELRRKLHDDKHNPIYIETVRGIGYRFLPRE